MWLVKWTTLSGAEFNAIGVGFITETLPSILRLFYTPNVATQRHETVWQWQVSDNKRTLSSSGNVCILTVLAVASWRFQITHLLPKCISQTYDDSKTSNYILLKINNFLFLFLLYNLLIINISLVSIFNGPEQSFYRIMMIFFKNSMMFFKSNRIYSLCPSLKFLRRKKKKNLPTYWSAQIRETIRTKLWLEDSVAVHHSPAFLYSSPGLKTQIGKILSSRFNVNS